MHIAIIPGHGWRGRGRQDPGAGSDAVEEATYVRLVADVCRSRGGSRVSVHDSPQHGPWTYQSRREAAHEAIGAGPGVVLHLHCNAGGGSYLMSMHDPRSSTGKTMAESWRDAAQGLAVSVNGKAIVREATRPTWDNAANLLVHSYASTPAGVAAVLLEVGFVDCSDHSPLWGNAGVSLVADTILAAFPS